MLIISSLYYINSMFSKNCKYEIIAKKNKKNYGENLSYHWALMLRSITFREKHDGKKNAERKNEQIFEQIMFWKNLELMHFA